MNLPEVTLERNFSEVEEELRSVFTVAKADKNIRRKGQIVFDSKFFFIFYANLIAYCNVAGEGEIVEEKKKRDFENKQS